MPHLHVSCMKHDFTDSLLSPQIGLQRHRLPDIAEGWKLPESRHQEVGEALPVRHPRQEDLQGTADAQAHEPRKCTNALNH